MSSTDDGIVHAIKISPHGGALLCAAAGIAPPEGENREGAGVDVQRQAQSLTKQPLDEIISEDDIVSRRPFRCAVCGGTFTVRQFDLLRRLSRGSGKSRPFDSGDPIHDGCSAQSY